VAKRSVSSHACTSAPGTSRGRSDIEELVPAHRQPLRLNAYHTYRHRSYEAVDTLHEVIRGALASHAEVD